MKITIAGIETDSTTNSLGIQAISDGLIRKVRLTFPEAEIACHTKRYDLSHDAWERVEKADNKPEHYPELIAELYKDFKKYYPDRIKDIRESKLLVVCGDGLITDFFQKWILMLTFEIMAAREHCIPYVTLDQSINATPSSIVGYVVSKYFLTSNISVRELDSRDLLTKRFNYPNATISIDSAFLVDNLFEKERTIFDKYLSEFKLKFNFSDYFTFSARGKRPSSQEINPDAWARYIYKSSRIFDLKPVFVSSCPKEDFPLAYEIKKVYEAKYNDEIIIIDELIDSVKYNYRFLLYLLEKAFINISDRYHQNVLSFLSRTPFIPVEGNTSKTNGLVQLLGYPFEIIPIISEDSLASAIDKTRHFALSYDEIKSFLLTQSSIEKYDNYSELLRKSLLSIPLFMSRKISRRL